METYEAMSYRQLQAAAKKAGVKASGSKVDILKRMEEYLAEQTSTTDEPRESSTPERAATSTEAPDSRDNMTEIKGLGGVTVDPSEYQEMSMKELRVVAKKLRFTPGRSKQSIIDQIVAHKAAIPTSLGADMGAESGSPQTSVEDVAATEQEVEQQQQQKPSEATIEEAEEEEEEEEEEPEEALTRGELVKLTVKELSSMLKKKGVKPLKLKKDIVTQVLEAYKEAEIEEADDEDVEESQAQPEVEEEEEQASITVEFKDGEVIASTEIDCVDDADDDEIEEEEEELSAVENNGEPSPFVADDVVEVLLNAAEGGLAVQEESGDDEVSENDGEEEDTVVYFVDDDEACDPRSDTLAEVLQVYHDVLEFKNGYVYCRVTGCKLPADAGIVTEHVQEKRTRMLIERSRIDLDELATYMIEPHPFEPNRLLCALTGASIPFTKAAVDMYITGKQFARRTAIAMKAQQVGSIDAKDLVAMMEFDQDIDEDEEFDDDDAEAPAQSFRLRGMPSPKGKKMYFDSPASSRSHAPARWNIADYSS